MMVMMAKQMAKAAASTAVEVAASTADKGIVGTIEVKVEATEVELRMNSSNNDLFFTSYYCRAPKIKCIKI